MQQWAVELQSFLLSGTQNKCALQQAITNCNDPEIRAYLPKLPPQNKEDIQQGMNLADKLVATGFQAESAILRVLASLPILQMLQSSAIAPEERKPLLVLLTNILENCRVDTILDPTLALLLSLKGNFYNNTRDYASALAAYEEARDIRRRLATSDPQSYQPDLAGTLNNLGNLYRDTRDYASALAAYEEARDIYRRLATSDPQSYQPNLATTLNNLGNLYSYTRDYASALAAYEEACDIRRRLATSDPQSYEPDLAGTLNNLGNLYRDTRDYASALAAYEEARDIYRRLATSDPQSYQPNFATTLNNLGNLYSDTRDYASALAVYEEACDIRRRLATSDPQSYQPNLATTLNNLGNLYSYTRDYTSALAVYEEACDIYRRLATSDPQSYQPDLAMTLNNLGALYSDTRDYASALAAYEEARDIRRRLATSDPQSYQPNLAETLNNLGNLYRDTREYASALAAYEEARDIYRRLATSDPQSYQPDLAMTLNNLGNLYRDTRDYTSALRAYEEAVKCAETTSNNHHLSKGRASAAYSALLGDAVEKPKKAFALAAAMRSALTKAQEIGYDDLKQTQSVLSDISKQEGSSVSILVVNAGGIDNDVATLGLISADDCVWHLIKAEGWNQLFPDAAPEQNNAARRTLGREIWQALPEPVQKALHPDGETQVWISADTLYSAFPWELLRFGDADDDYLGLHQPLPRIGSILAPELQEAMQSGKLGRGVKSTSVIAPHTTGTKLLSGVLQEAKVIKRRISELGGEMLAFRTGEGAHDGVMREALKANPDILYYTGHGDIIANEEMLILHAETPRGPKPEDKIMYFGRYQLDETADMNGMERLFEHKPLVVLNSCHTGRMKEYGGQREDMVDSLLAHGAGAVVATALPIYDVVGAALGEALFDEDALHSPTIGALIVEARNILATGVCQDINSPLWGAWGMVHLHGSARMSHPFQTKKGSV